MNKVIFKQVSRYTYLLQSHKGQICSSHFSRDTINHDNKIKFPQIQQTYLIIKITLLSVLFKKKTKSILTTLIIRKNKAHKI